MTKGLVPLQHSWAFNELEADLKNLVIDLYTSMLKPQADEINVYGAPYLGSKRLINKFVQQDGLALVNTGDETAARYVFKAWKYRNPERGLHFARTYMQTLFPDKFTLNQVYQKKSQPYPTALASKEDMALYGLNPDDYYLTSRVRIDLSTQDFVPTTIAHSLRTTIAARLLVDLRIAGWMKQTAGVAMFTGGATICRTAGVAKSPNFKMETKTGVASVFGASNLALFAGR